MGKKKKDNEVYLGLIGTITGKYWVGVGQWDREGSPGEVRFDPYAILDREETHGDIVGFFHTHPHSPASPSSTDKKTMEGWTICFGRPLVCIIKGINGLKAHWYINDEHPHATGWVQQFGRIFIGRLPGRIRKELKRREKEQRKKEKEPQVPEAEAAV